MQTSQIQPTTRLIAIGDVHGHVKNLNVLLNEINPTQNDTIVFLGDLINRGPNSKQTLELIINLQNVTKIITILGNHEEMLLHANYKDDLKFFLKFGGDKTLESYNVQNISQIPHDHMMFFANALDYAQNDQFIFTHASLNPNKELHNQSPDDLRWKKYPNDHNFNKILVCGHTPNKNVVSIPNIICIDTGCGTLPNGKLTAIDLTNNQLFQASKTKVIKKNYEILRRN